MGLKFQKMDFFKLLPIFRLLDNYNKNKNKNKTKKKKNQKQLCCHGNGKKRKIGNFLYFWPVFGKKKTNF